jgi:hybrid cluster-associated redox disulfide protein
MEAVTKDITFGDLLQNKPEAAEILAAYGLHCIGCHIAVFETIEQGAKAHGLSDEQVDELITKINS